MILREIPLASVPETFQINLAGVTYRLTMRWADAPGGGWIMDIDDAKGVPLLSGLPLVTGADLLAQFTYAGIAGGLFVQTDHDADAVPTFTNLGRTSHLYFVTP